MTRTQVFLIATIQLVSASLCRAFVMGSDSLDIDFTEPKDANQKAVWYMPGRPTSQPAADAEHPYPVWQRNQTWFHTKPLAVGPRQRSPQGVSVHVEIQPPAAERKFPGGHTAPRDNGTVYVRYSPDRLHWSSWQALQEGDDRPGRGTGTGRLFSGVVRVPMLERAEYGELSVRYGELTKDWHHTDVVSRWIRHNDPQFFARHLPFIAYVEFLYEENSPGGTPIDSFHARLGWGVSGMEPMTKPKPVRPEDVPWDGPADRPTPATAPSSSHASSTRPGD